MRSSSRGLGTRSTTSPRPAVYRETAHIRREKRIRSIARCSTSRDELRKLGLNRCLRPQVPPAIEIEIEKIDAQTKQKEHARNATGQSEKRKKPLAATIPTAHYDVDRHVVIDEHSKGFGVGTVTQAGRLAARHNPVRHVNDRSPNRRLSRLLQAWNRDQNCDRCDRNDGHQSEQRKTTVLTRNHLARSPPKRFGQKASRELACDLRGHHLDATSLPLAEDIRYK